MKQMGCTEVTPLARLGVFSMSEVAREDNALMNYVFSPKACACFSVFRYCIPRFCVGLIACLHVVKPALRVTN